MKIKHPPICPTCGKKCWREGHLVEMGFHTENNVRPATFCMWCCAVWSLEPFEDGDVVCVPATEEELQLADKHMGKYRESQRQKIAFAKELGIPLEEFIKQLEQLKGYQATFPKTEGNA